MAISAILSIVILGLLVVFQIALIFGAPIGNFAWGGYHKILPTKLRIGSVVSIFIYSAIALLIASKANIVSTTIDVNTLNKILWFIFGYLILGVIMNAASRSKPERYTMTPVVLTLVVCIYFIIKI